MTRTEAPPARPGRTLRLWLPVPAYVALVLAVSAWTAPDTAPLGTGSDKWLHALEYGGLTALLARAVALQFPDATRTQIVAAASSFGLSVGALDELLQSFAPLRTSDWADLAADLVGATLAGVAVAFWYRRSRARSQA